MELRAGELRRPFQDEALLEALLAGRDVEAGLEPWRVAQLRSFCPSAIEASEFSPDELRELWEALEVVDLIDEETGQPQFQLYVWPLGSAALFRHGTASPELGYACQHGFVLAEPDELLHTAIGLAYLDARERVGLRGSLSF